MVLFENIVVPKISESIVSQIEDFILSGALKSGEKLPSERQLAQQLNVSRPSIREAISILEAKNLVICKRGGGTYVTNTVTEGFTGPLASILQDKPESAFEILELRKSLEEMAAYYAAKRATNTDKDILKRRLDTLLEYYSGDEFNPEFETKSDVEFHLAIADASHNFALSHVMRGLFDALYITISQNLDRLRSNREDHILIQQQHQNICDAILMGDARKAKTYAREHLALVESNLKQLMQEQKRESKAKRRVVK